MSTDPVTVDSQPDRPEPDVYRTAVQAMTAVLEKIWSAPPAVLAARASSWLDLAMEVDRPDAAILIRGNPADAHRVADAVRRTGVNNCAACPVRPGPYNGQPAEQDLRAAGEVIERLTQGS